MSLPAWVCLCLLLVDWLFVYSSLIFSIVASPTLGCCLLLPPRSLLACVSCTTRTPGMEHSPKASTQCTCFLFGVLCTGSLHSAIHDVTPLEACRENASDSCFRPTALLFLRSTGLQGTIYRPSFGAPTQHSASARSNPTQTCMHEQPTRLPGLCSRCPAACTHVCMAILIYPSHQLNKIQCLP